MYNSAQRITAENLDGLLRDFLLETNTIPVVQQVFEMQSGFVFSGKNSPESFSKSEKNIIEKLANEKGYISSKGNDKRLFAWIFSSLFVFMILFFVWKLFIMADNKQAASQVYRDVSVISNEFFSENESKKPADKKENKFFIAFSSDLTDTIKQDSSHKPESRGKEAYHMKSNFPFRATTYADNSGKRLYLNLGFEQTVPDTDLPDVWYAGDGGYFGAEVYDVKIDSTVKYSGKNSMKLSCSDKKSKDHIFGCLTNSIPNEYFIGKNVIEISAYIKTENAEGGSASLWCSEWDNNPERNAIQYANSTLQFTEGSTDWKQCNIELPVDSSAKTLTFGGFFSGTGIAWFDDFAISINGIKIDDSIPAFIDPGVNEIAWLDNNCIPIKTVNASENFSDLTPLKKLIGEQKIVSFQNLIAGSSEMQKMNSRMIKFFATEMGYHICIADIDMADAKTLNDYILTGTGDPEKIIRSLQSWSFKSSEMLDMIKWMKEYNQKETNKIMLLSLDPSNTNFLIEKIKSHADEINNKTLLRKICKYEKSFFKVLKTKEKIVNDMGYVNIYMEKGLLSKIEPLYDKLLGYYEKAEYDKNTLSVTDSIRQIMVYLKQNYMQSFCTGSYYYSRQFAAENLKYILQQFPDEKFVLSNVYTSYMDTVIDKICGKYNIGLTADSGTCTAYSSSVLSVNNLFSSYPGTYENYFKQCRYPDFFIDLGNIDSTNISCTWLKNDMGIRFVGEAFLEKQFYISTITDHYDAIIFFRNTNSSDNFDIGKAKEN